MPNCGATTRSSWSITLGFMQRCISSTHIRWLPRMPYFTRFDAASEALGRQLQIDEGGDPSAASVAQSPTITERVEGGGLCSRSGWWITPAKVSSRRYFKAGEIMPVIEGSQYGATFWQWDIDQSSATV